MMDELFWLLLVLGLVTLAGHGIWVLSATILRVIFGKTDDRSVESYIRCLECSAMLQPGDDFCPVCGRYQKDVAKAGPLAELAMTVRQMDRLLSLGQINAATHQAVMQAIEKERERLTQPIRPGQTPVTETPPPTPVVAPQPDNVLPTLIAERIHVLREQNSESVSVRVEADSFPAMKNPASPVEAVIQGPAQSLAPAIEPTPVYSKVEPRRSLTEMLETFMEESSIRWGELIGGLLIIGCSLALVISLWSQIKGEPLLRISVFVGMTTGLFGLGFYSAHRWKLPTTSRGALIISTLLVPLNFLAMAKLPNWPILIGVELLALVLFLYLVSQAAKVIAPGNSWWMACATLVPSFAMMMVKYWPVGFAVNGELLFLGIAPLISYWISTGVMLRGLKEGHAETEDEAGRNFTLFGIASFASLLPVGLFLVKSGGLLHSRGQFAPLIALLGIPAITSGLTMRQAKASQVNGVGKTQTTATAVALLGALLALAGPVLAWPQAGTVITVALINCVVCAAIAWRFDLKQSHAAAQVFFALAYLIVCNVLVGTYPSWSEDGARLISSFVTNTSGIAWMTLFVLFAAAAEAWRRYGYKPESRLHEFAAVCAGFFSLLILTWRGFGRAGDPGQLTLVYLFYAAAAFAIAWYRDWFFASWAGLCLALLTTVQLFVYRYSYSMSPYHPARLSILIYASLAAIGAIGFRMSGGKTRRIFGWPLTAAALISSVAVAPFLLFGGWMTVGQMSVRLLWLAAIWLALSVVNRWPILFTAFQAALTAGIVCSVAAIFDSRALPSHSSWLDPYALQAQGIALALLSLMWLLLRLAIRRWDDSESEATVSFKKLLSPNWPTVDRVVTIAVWGLLITLSIGSVSDRAAITFAPIATLHTGFSDFSDRAQGFGSWLMLIVLLLVFAVSLWERFSKRTVLAIMTLLGSACLLMAGSWRGSGSPLVSLRWLLAISFALIALPIIFRKQIRQGCEPLKWPRMDEESRGLASLSRATSIALFAAPTLLLTGFFFLPWLLHGQQSFVERILFLIPLLILSLALSAHAIRERSSAYAFSSGLMLNLAATLGTLLDSDVRLITVLQANVIVTAGFSLAWLEVGKWLARRKSELGQTAPLVLRTQIVCALCASLVLLVIADLRLFLSPEHHGVIAASMGNAWGWLTVLLSALAWASLRGWRFERLRVDYLAIALLAAASLVVCSIGCFASGWASYYALMMGIALTAWLMLALCWKREVIFKRFQIEGRDTSVEWATILGLVQFIATIRGIESSNDLWWTAGSFAALCLFFAGLAIVTKHRAYVYLSGVLCNLMAGRLFVEYHDLLNHFEDFLFVNIIVLALSSLAWLALDIKVMRRDNAQSKGRIAPFHKFAAILSLAAIAFISGFEWLEGLGGGIATAYIRLDWFSVISVVVLLIACLWDSQSKLALGGLYLFGIVVIGKANAWTDFSRDTLLVSTSAFLALYVLATVIVWRWRRLFLQSAASLRLPYQIYSTEQVQSWLVKGSVLLAAFITCSSVLTIFNSHSLKLRLLTTTAAFALPVAFALLARGAQRQWMIAGSIRLLLLNVVLWGWAWLPFGLQAINRLVIVMLIAEAVLIGYRLLAVNQLPEGSVWKKSLRADLPVIAGLGGLSLFFVLVSEVTNYLGFGNAMIAWPVVFAVLVTLFGWCLIGLAFAVLPGEDPFGLDERGRMRYVYAAEACIVLLLMHVRVTVPWLFGGRFSAYWPLIVMALAFGGVGLSELFRRQAKLVLAEPLERTGILLPLLPVIGFWALGSEVSYSALLLVVGLFYGWLSVRRRSFGFGLLAALAGNGGLWHFLHGADGYRFSQHPQLWLIPVALSVLLAARINRDSLSPEQHSSIRYGALIMIYVSSTADIFLNGVDDSPWLPIVLAVLSVCGVIAGLMLRVRSFLFLGTAFLLLSLLTMIWSASVNLNWTWLWYVTGIALGVFIIYTFAMFERKREEMLRFVERLKQWQ